MHSSTRCHSQLEAIAPWATASAGTMYLTKDMAMCSTNATVLVMSFHLQPEGGKRRDVNIPERMQELIKQENERRNGLENEREAIGELNKERTSGRVGGRKKNKKFGGKRKEAQVGSGDLLCTDTEYKYNTPYLGVYIQHNTASGAQSCFFDDPLF